MRLAFDIETDGLLGQMTTVHSLVVQDVDTGEMWSCKVLNASGVTLPSIADGLKKLMEADLVIGHNIIKFDIPAIQKVYPWFTIERPKIEDTLLRSRLVFPDLKDMDFKARHKTRNKIRAKLSRDPKYEERDDHGGPLHNFDHDLNEALKKNFPGQLIGSHGLEAWGYRLGEWKGDYSAEMKAKGLDPWAEWNPEMQAYCEQDVVVTNKLFWTLLKKKYPERAVRIEVDFAVILAEMERNGFPFHNEGAKELQRRLSVRAAEINDQLQKAFPPITERWTFTPKANNSKLGYVKGKPVEKSKEIFFNPTSRPHIARWLKQKYGWKPKEYTDTGQPVVDEKVLASLNYPEAELLAEYFMLDKRLGMLEGKGGKGLIPAGKSGRIHGNVNTNGAVTRRCTHTKPNMAQLPATSVPYGREFRGLMYAPRGWSLLGWDASGLELRCFAHYMAYYDGGAYTDTVLSGDIHWKHVIALGLVPEGTDRYAGYDANGAPIEIEEHERLRGKIAKRFIYAYLYGAGDELIGEIVKPNGTSAQKIKAGKNLKDAFLKRTPALARLKARLAAQIRERAGKVKAIDGGVMHVRSEHSALNTLLQSAGAIAVKVATILFYDKLNDEGLKSGEDFMLVAHVHDEVQVLVKKGKEDLVGSIAEEAMREAGEALGFRCPLAAEYKYGNSWADTH